MIAADRNRRRLAPAEQGHGGAGMTSARFNPRKVLALASARAAVRWPHGTNSADDLADVVRDAISDIQGEAPTAENLLERFIAWRDLAQDPDNDCQYLNGGLGSDRSGWDDLDDLAEAARTFLAKAGVL